MATDARKKWVALVLVATVCTAILSSIQIDHTADKQVIYIKGGEPVLADSVTQSDQFVFYQSEGTTGMFMRDDVTSVGSIQVQNKTYWIKAIDRSKQRLMTDMGFSAKITRVADTRLLVFLVMFALAFGAMKLGPVLFNTIKRKMLASPAGEPSAMTADKISPVTQDGEETSAFRDIVLFFLELFRLQNGIDKDAPARFSMTAASSMSKMKVFELGIKAENDWLTRRMSIGPLGEDTGSKSKCFYVIYDTHMVVKIPPTPVTDMVKYVGDIRREVQIAAQLSPISCIIPMVSVVLKKVKKLPYESSLTQEQLEKQYIRLVEENTEYQEYLKIGDRFAFFMELTNNFFLGRVIGELHRSKHDFGDEIREAPEVAWNQEAFTARYGLDSLPVFEGLQTLYRLCEAEANRIVRENGRGEKVLPFQIRNWFLACITGDAPRGQEKGIDPELLKRIKDAFATIFKSNQQPVDDLIQLLKTQLATKTFLKSRQQIANLASNMLRLLCRLKHNRIALRDLKPDNLYLDADPDNYPVFLKDTSAFAIGVIDVETAVSVVPSADGTVAQPLIGGTPLYATPLHLLRNGTISAFFGDVSDALHLQDWFATIAIIFKTATGSNLFPRAARSFPAMLKIMKSSQDRSNPDESTVKAMSQRFWSAAAADVRSQLTSFSEVLNQLTLPVPDDLEPTIKAELDREEACLNQAIGRHVALSPLFKSEKNRTFLIEASCDAIIKQVERWKNPDQLPEQHRKVAPRMVAFLNNLNRLKQGEMEKRRAIAAFTGPTHEISAYCLVEAMFQIAFRAMYKARWNAIPKPAGASEENSAVEENRSMVTTILNDN